MSNISSYECGEMLSDSSTQTCGPTSTRVVGVETGCVPVRSATHQTQSGHSVTLTSHRLVRDGHQWTLNENENKMKTRALK